MDPARVYEAIHDEMKTVLIGNDDIIEGLTISLLTGGHVLLEGPPGVAKTTAANLFARTIGLDYKRIQMTPDVLPADITGTHIFHEQTNEFTLQKGPIFANVVVADEINRASPKTQSALLEAMQEQQVTIEGETLALPEPFIVLATQNPIEMEGTFELPAAQRDRFQFKLIIDLPNRADESELVERFKTDPELGPASVDRVVSVDDLLSARAAVREIYIDSSITEYILDIMAATRDHVDIDHGASPRATLTFIQAVKARAAIDHREYVIPDDVKALAEPVLSHRLLLNAESELSGLTPTEVVADVLDSVAPPGSETETDQTATANGGFAPESTDER
ncbi:MoxR family ATPase [Halalkalicoccus sp. GCM10025322]|uniref:AAA family ATPase n=1 Tax=Halalkalicoccus TaxID=332246 RepID=UPI002F96593B